MLIALSGPPSASPEIGFPDMPLVLDFMLMMFCAAMLPGDKGVPDEGGDEVEGSDVPIDDGVPLGVGAGDACGISFGLGTLVPVETFECSALPDLERAQSPESKYFRS